MVVRYQHATDERDSALAKLLPVLLPVACPDQNDSHVEEEAAPPLNSETKKNAPGGETRTLNLAEGDEEAS